MRYSVIERIKKYIDEYEVLRDYETFEIMPIFNQYKELDCLKYFIKKEYYTSFFVDLAIMYVNLGFLYAKSQLKKNDLNNYLIGFEVFYIEENVKELGYLSDVHVFYTRKAKSILNNIGVPVDYKQTKIYNYVKNQTGLSDFTCYFLYSEEYGEAIEEFFFIPKKLDLQKTI